ncbi:flagellar protein FlbD [Caldanaerobius fijiensis DSM 17918]|uniref:Flagellar protein FlbD n=1 Tax=Caldanaerobius fijiensis DSM 17918 TaxID=1121256 RepID=A0A1M4XND2_9THEO|nr:flagellar FlbD family protein [Caldanaerobius fijiensis]SHE94722.1 flagellar protein FlbD [Caldanaerobius fijiensis DSM 17918]
MIKVNRLNGKEFVINADLIECIEATPDTVITLTTGNKYVVQQSLDEVIEMVLNYKRQINGCFKVVE